jgi:hypothetical protein
MKNRMTGGDDCSPLNSIVLGHTVAVDRGVVAEGMLLCFDLFLYLYKCGEIFLVSIYINIFLMISV